MLLEWPTQSLKAYIFPSCVILYSDLVGYIKSHKDKLRIVALKKYKYCYKTFRKSNCLHPLFSPGSRRAFKVIWGNYCTPRTKEETGTTLRFRTMTASIEQGHWCSDDGSFCNSDSRTSLISPCSERLILTWGLRCNIFPSLCSGTLLHWSLYDVFGFFFTPRSAAFNNFVFKLTFCVKHLQHHFYFSSSERGCPEWGNARGWTVSPLQP